MHVLSGSDRPTHTPSPTHLRVVPTPEIDPERYVGAVNRAVSMAARRLRLSATETEDLRSDLWLKLLAKNGRLLRLLQDVPRVDSYLACVARNLVLDGRNADFGKWRPSIVAKRGGADAVLIDRLMTRDGLSAAEAEEYLRCARPSINPASIRHFASQMPARRGRRPVDVALLDSLPSMSANPVEALLLEEAAGDASTLSAVLMRSLASLSSEDRWLLAQRYAQQMTIADIARTGGYPAKVLYRHFDMLLRRLRRALAASGIERGASLQAIANGQLEWTAGLETMAPARANVRQSA